MHQPPFVIDEEIEITPTPLTSTRHAGSSAWNASSATFLHHNTEKSNGNSDVTSNSIRRMAMSEHERVAILAGFRSDWEKLNREFQRMPISTKRMGR